jgi:hypothetical protein
MNQTAQTFSRIIAPIVAEEFFNDYWEKKPLFVKRDSPGYYSDALTAADIDAYLQNRHLSPGFLNVLTDGKPAPKEQWTYLKQNARNNFSERLVDVVKLLKLYDEGATIVLNSGETALTLLNDLCGNLENELKCHIQANIYITPPNSQGFAPHFDAHNVLILQIHGSKHWKLYDFPVELPVQTTSVSEMRYEEREPGAEIEMQPGDMLYIPRGMVHCARAERDSSIHATIGVMVKPWSSLLKMLVREAEKDRNFRRLLPLGSSGENENSDFAAEFARHLQKLIERTDLTELCRAAFLENREADFRGRFTDSLQIEQLTVDSLVCLRASLDYSTERTKEWLFVRFAAEEIVLPLFLEQTMIKMFKEKTFAVREVEGIPNDAGKLALVKRFVKAGFLRIISI